MNSVSRDKEPNKTHVMSEWRTEVRCPGSTPRFYGVRNCESCGFEEMSHPAGHFMDNELLSPCLGVNSNDSD